MNLLIETVKLEKLWFRPSQKIVLQLPNYIVKCFFTTIYG